MGTCVAISNNQNQLPPECAGAFGRDREIAELESLLLDSRLEPPPVVIVHGRRGIGKTMLAAALAQRAGARRMDVVWAGESSLAELPADSLVIVDDAAELDAAKLERLAELTQSAAPLRLLVLCRGVRFRLPPQLVGWLDPLQGDPGCRFIELGPLQRDDAEALVRAACGRTVPDQTIELIIRRAAGDPSLLKEFTRVLRRDRTAEVRVDVPQTIAGLVALRLATLDATQRPVVETASLFSNGFAVDWLAPAVGLSESDTLAALAAGEDAGLLEQCGDDRFTLCAPVVADAIRSEAFGGHLQRAHRRLAEALIVPYGEPDPAAAAEAARQYHSSRQLPGADRGVEPALLAAGHALATRHPLRAAESLELGLELCAGDRPATRARLTSALAKALASALCHTRTVAALEQACQRLLAAGASSTQVAELVIEVSCALPLAIGSGDASAPERLRGLVGEVDAPVGERLLAALGWRQPQMTSTALLHTRMIRVARAGDGQQRSAAVFRAAAETVEVLLDPGLTRQLVQQARDEAQELGSGAAWSLACSVQAVAAARAGDLSAAAELAQAGVDALGQQDLGVREPPLAELIQLLTEMQAGSDDWQRLAAVAARVANEHSYSPYCVSLTALAALARVRAGDTQGARAALREVIGALQPVQRYSAAASAAVGPAVEAALRLNDVALGEGLLPLVRRVLEAGGGDFYMSQRDLTLGRLALLLGHADEARAAFERARVALDAAHERTLRALLDGERHQALAAAFESSPDPGPGGLTRRQREVLLLLAEGLTSQQIAERLVVSVNTVNRHIADIYRKIDASNRVGAAAYVARHGLVR